MAVEILERDLRVPIRDLHGSDIAYDVHVRRVFLRTGLADRDDVDHIVAAGRRLYPERPGAIDFPMWDIGRRWCRPGVPRCSECVLFSVCPRLVDRAANVYGRGPRRCGRTRTAACFLWKDSRPRRPRENWAHRQTPDTQCGRTRGALAQYDRACVQVIDGAEKRAGPPANV